MSPEYVHFIDFLDHNSEYGAKRQWNFFSFTAEEMVHYWTYKRQLIGL